MFSSVVSLLLALGHLANAQTSNITGSSRLGCRNVPGNPGFPTSSQWAALNTSLAGKLVTVIPSAQFCKNQGGCTSQQLTSSVFRANIPGAMNQVNWEQDYDSTPPSLCEPSTEVCGQGDVPLFGVLAESASDIQIGVNFARTHNLRLAVKASGHDYLGRSTAKNSLLISTHQLQTIVYTDAFIVNGKNLGSAVTLGSGVSLQQMYKSNQAKGKFTVGGTAATVVPSGGYVQGGGHSFLSPTFGLAADNCLEFNVVLADGSLVVANQAQHSDLFWAMRGGGAGSWGIIVSATFRTFPTFNATFNNIVVIANHTDILATVAMVHAKHIFDWDSFRVGQYFYLTLTNITGASTPGVPTMLFTTFFPNTSPEKATAALQPFITDMQAISGVTITQETGESEINAALVSADDAVGADAVLGSRLVPPNAYTSPQTVEKVYKQLLDGGATNILGLLVAGGKVSENANISSAVNPAWRTAKTHMILANGWVDAATIPQVHGNETLFQKEQLPILEILAGKDAGSYSNEADALEPHFQTTFFGPNYAKLSAIKLKYDPTDLFIVKAGVGSERWDADGICRVIA